MLYILYTIYIYIYWGNIGTWEQGTGEHRDGGT